MVLCILYSKCKQMFGYYCYLTNTGREFLLWFLFPLKMGLPSLRVYYRSVSSCKGCYHYYWQDIFKFFFSGFTNLNGKSYLYFATKCKQIYALLSHHYWQRFFTLDCCSVTSNESKMHPLKWVS